MNKITFSQWEVDPFTARVVGILTVRRSVNINKNDLHNPGTLPEIQQQITNSIIDEAHNIDLQGNIEYKRRVINEALRKFNIKEMSSATESLLFDGSFPTLHSFQTWINTEYK